MRRLYLQIYLAFLAALLLVVVLVSLTWLSLTPDDGTGLDALASVAQEILPPGGASTEELEAALRRLSGRYQVSLALSSPEGERIAAAGRESLPPRRGRSLAVRGFHQRLSGRDPGGSGARSPAAEEPPRERAKARP